MRVRDIGIGKLEAGIWDGMAGKRGVLNENWVCSCQEIF